jgi:hypothetical protein
MMHKSYIKPSQKKDFGTESRHIRVETRRHTGVCRGFSRRINAESGTKDFFEMACRNKSIVFRHVK